MKIVTVATEEKFHFKNLKKSVEAQGQTLHVLGKGATYPGHYMKDIWMINFCHTIPRGEIVLFLDGYDSIVCGDLKELESEFIDTKLPMIISVDDSANELWAYVYNKIFYFRGNPGMYIGYAGHICDFIEAVRSDVGRANNPSNQSAWGKFYTTQPKEKWLAVDENHDFFYNRKLFVPTDDSSFEVRRDKTFPELYIKGKKVYIVSAPGNTDINDLIVKLGYDRIVQKKTLATNAKYYLGFFIPEILLLCTILIVIIVVVVLYLKRKRV